MTENSVTPDNFYIAGGALPPDSPSYIERPADDELFKAALAGDFCYVLADHHMGKSSLMFRTAWRLQQQGIRTVEFDLSGINADVDVPTAYLILIRRLNFELNLAIDPDSWWTNHSSLEASARFSTFLQEIVLTKIEQPIVVFIDSVDKATINTRFFASLTTEIQTCYGKRISEPDFNRLNFVILGMSTGDDLNRKGNISLLDSGHQIILNEFTREQCRTLQKGLPFNDSEQSKSIFDRILFWTAGHPYLTQKLCLATATTGNQRWSTTQVDTLIEQLFVTHPLNEDPNLQFIENYIKNSPHQQQLLKFYRQVYDGNVTSNGHSEQKELKLIGLIGTENETLQVRNALYREVFDPTWIKAVMPTRWKRYIAVLSVMLILIVVGAVGFFIRQQQQRANEAQLLTENFRSATRAEEQIIALAGLLELPGYREQAQQLFLQELAAEDQLAMFNISNPVIVGDPLITVVENIYTNANIDDEHRYDLLEAMSIPLHQIQSSSLGAIELELEINQWLRGKDFYHNEELYQRAVDAYSIAININNLNPGIYFDRGLAYAALDNPGQALADFTQVLNLDEAWQSRVQELLIDDPTLYATLWTDQSDNNVLIALVPAPTNTPTPTITPTNSPTPTPTPTNVPPTETPTVTPTSTTTPTPTSTAIPTRLVQPANNTPTPITPNGVITLLHPTLIDEPSYGPTQFEWQWVGNLPPEFGFEVRVWKEDNTPTGVHNSVLDNQNGNIEYIGDNTYRLNTDITNATGIKGTGEYLWTVALVRIAPSYEDIRQQAEPDQMRYAVLVPSSGDDDTGGGGDGGGVGIE